MQSRRCRGSLRSPAASRPPERPNRPARCRAGRAAGARGPRPFHTLFAGGRGSWRVARGHPRGGNDAFRPALQVMLVGDSGVGKTCLLVRFKDGAFLAGSFISTVGIDFRAASLVSHLSAPLQIWDTAGQERFRSVTHAYYRDAHALLLLYDVTNKASFDNIQAWLTEIHEYAQQDVVLMLLGNKVDSTQDRVVKREDGEKLAKEYGVPFMETSAKSGLNVELAFTAIAKELKHRSMKLPNEPKFKLHDYVKKEVRGSGCCRS
uniref:small monomeric GTPase n=1 Tax=Nothoprocta perdicaria TaxID=30464 RepID=A0A8C6ZQV0_NOTPE